MKKMNAITPLIFFLCFIPCCCVGQDTPELNKELSEEHNFAELLKSQLKAYENLQQDTPSEERQTIINKINELGRLLFQPNIGNGHCLSTSQVQSGESLSLIARRMGCSVQALVRINQIVSPDRIFPNMKLFAPKGDRKILIDKHHFELTLFIGEAIFQIYSVGLGAQGRDTPIGETTISSSMAKFPTYTDRETNITYPYGDPLNPVGSRWMGLSMGGGYGIHGTQDETSIGKAKSKGCIRMKREDLEELFDFVRSGDPVSIR